MAYYKQITATTQINNGARKLKGIFVSAASATPTITVYDSQQSSTADPKIIDTFTPVSATFYPFAQYDNGIWGNKGLYVVISGTVSCTVFYE